MAKGKRPQRESGESAAASPAHTIATSGVHVDTTSFFLIVLSAAVASVTVAVLPSRLAPPVVVFELLFGIVIGPHCHYADLVAG